MKSGSSALISSGGQSGEAAAIISWYQTSRPSSQWMSPPVRLITITFSTVAHFLTASSVLVLSGILRAPRIPSSAVITTFDVQSLMRPASASGEKPPNTTEWIAPTRAQANMAITSSGTMGM